MKTRNLLCLAAFVATPAYGCETAPFDATADVKNAEYISVGYVTGERYPRLEERILRGEDPQLREAPERRIVRVAIVETIKGTRHKTIEVVVSCASPRPVIGERVIVNRAQDKWLRVHLAEFEEENFRNALQGGL